MDWALYWFMFPVAIGVATTAMLSGIGGSALFIPILVVIFPLLGPEYNLTTAAAIGTALITQLFGFGSGFVGYYRRRLIDFESAVPFIRVAVPVAVMGALILVLLKEHEALLKGAYAMVMIALCPVIMRRTVSAPGSNENSSGSEGPTSGAPVRSITARSGETYSYPAPRIGITGSFFTAVGAFLTGLLGVGIGEVIVPQLLKRHHFPVAVAAATSVFTVIVTIAAASSTQVAALVSAGGVSALPWNMVVYTVPGVIIGGQIGPLLQGRIARRTMEKGIALLFGLIGAAMLWTAMV